MLFSVDDKQRISAPKNRTVALHGISARTHKVKSLLILARIVRARMKALLAA
jgi:hypothetical protein